MNGTSEHVTKRVVSSAFGKKAGCSRSVNGTRACIRAEIMEIDGNDLRGEAQRANERKRSGKSETAERRQGGRAAGRKGGRAQGRKSGRAEGVGRSRSEIHEMDVGTQPSSFALLLSIFPLGIWNGTAYDCAVSNERIERKVREQEGKERNRRNETRKMKMKTIGILHIEKDRDISNESERMNAKRPRKVDAKECSIKAFRLRFLPQPTWLRPRFR